MKTKIENGIEYTLKNDIWYPIFKMKEDGIQLGKYGMMRKSFLEQHRQALYDRMALVGKLYAHCKEIEDQALILLKETIDHCNAKGMDIIQAFEVADEIVKHELIFHQ